jgi:hypothetical protein
MEHDTFAQWRKKPAAAAAPPPEPEKYVAFETKDKVLRLRVRTADDSVHAPDYNLLPNILSDRQGTHFILEFTTLTVMVRGRNLQTIIFAIENGLADFIQEFDYNRWPEPTDAAAPFIESIEVKTGDSSMPAGETQH